MRILKIQILQVQQRIMEVPVKTLKSRFLKILLKFRKKHSLKEARKHLLQMEEQTREAARLLQIQAEKSLSNIFKKNLCPGRLMIFGTAWTQVLSL